MFFSVVVVVVLSRGAVQSLFSQPSVSSLGRTEERERANSPYLLKELCHEIGAQATSTEQLLRRLRKRHLKSKVALLQTLSRLFHFVQFKCWQIFLDLNSKKNYQGSGNEKESRCRVFTSFTEREIRHSRKCKEMYKKA